MLHSTRSNIFVGPVVLVGLIYPVCAQSPDRAKQALNDGNYQEAAELFQKTAESTPRCDARFYLGLARFRLKQLDAALIAFQSAVQCDPKYAEAYTALGEVYVQKGNRDKALPAYLQALTLAPASVPALRGAAAIYLDREENYEAIPLLEKLVSVKKSDPQSHADLGAAYAATSNWSAAQSQFEEALRIKGNDASALTGLGNLYLREGDGSRGIPLLKKAVATAPGAFEPRFLLGSAYSQTGNYRDALVEFEAALRLGGEQPESYYQLARVYKALGREADRRRALSRFAALARKSKDDAEAQRTVAKLTEQAKPLIDAGDLKAAVSLMEQARRLRPSDDGVLFRLAGLDYDLHQYDAARDYAEAAIGVAPSEWLYHFLLGLIEKKSERLREARTSLETAERLNSSAAPVQNALGELAMEENNPSGAIAKFEWAATLDPQEPTYRTNLESARAAAGQAHTATKSKEHK
jgi:tetratricopeptide (TPR) repeat protein